MCCGRWDVAQVPPEQAAGGGVPGWEMVVSCTGEVQAGGQLLLSYGERGNDDFLMHYGTTAHAPAGRTAWHQASP